MKSSEMKTQIEMKALDLKSAETKALETKALEMKTANARIEGMTESIPPQSKSIPPQSKSIPPQSKSIPPQSKSIPPQSTGRTLLADPNGPIELFPLRPGGPLRYREATPAEIEQWQERCRVVLRGAAARNYQDTAAGPTLGTRLETLSRSDSAVSHLVSDHLISDHLISEAERPANRERSIDRKRAIDGERQIA